MVHVFFLLWTISIYRVEFHLFVVAVAMFGRLFKSAVVVVLFVSVSVSMCV